MSTYVVTLVLVTTSFWFFEMRTWTYLKLLLLEFCHQPTRLLVFCQQRHQSVVFQETPNFTRAFSTETISNSHLNFLTSTNIKPAIFQASSPMQASSRLFPQGPDFSLSQVGLAYA
jgi:hypothetical protein